MLDAGNLIVIILLGWILICAGNPLLGVCEIFAVCHICGSHWGKMTHLNRQWTSHVTLHTCISGGACGGHVSLVRVQQVPDEAHHERDEAGRGVGILF